MASVNRGAKPDKDAKPDSILDEAKEAFKLADDREHENRADALDDIRFAVLEEQWPAEVKKQRDTDGRPCLTVNQLAPYIQQVVNDARQNKPAIKCHPADNAADPDTAEILNGLIRQIEAASKADIAYDTALECAVTSGFGYFRINTAYACDDSFDLELKIEPVTNPFSVWGDPYVQEADSANWNSAFVAEMMPRKVFEQTYKGAEKVDWDTGAYSKLDSRWCEGGEIRVAEWWTREKAPRTILLLSDQRIVPADEFEANREMFDAAGLSVAGSRKIESYKVRQRLLTGAEVLEERDWPGRYIPIIPVYGKTVNVEGKVYYRSLIRSSKDPQRMFNYWRTATTELVALAPKTPFIGAVGQFVTDISKWQSANTDSHAFIEYDLVGGAAAPERQPFAGPPAGALQEAANAQADIQSTMGLFNPSIGQEGNETSGKMLLMRRKEGDTATFHFNDNLSRSVEHGGRILVDLIPAVYGGERMIRVLGPEGQRPPPIQLGQPAPVLDAKGAPKLAMGQDGKPLQGPDGRALAMTRIYDLGVGRYDVAVETGPSFSTRREETANYIIEIIRAFPQAATVLADILAKNLDWPDADEVAERLRALLPPEARGEDPRIAELTKAMEQMKAQGLEQIQELKDALRTAEATVVDMQVKLDGAKADATNDAEKIRIERYKAETDRFKAIAPKGLTANVTPEQAAEVVGHVMSQLGTGQDIDPGLDLGAFARTIDGQAMPMPGRAPGF